MEYAKLFPGAGIEVLCAVWLMLAAYGCGRLLFCKAENAPSHLVMLACGMALDSCLGVFVPVVVMLPVLAAAGCFGAYKLFFEIKKSPNIILATFDCFVK